MTISRTITIWCEHYNHDTDSHCPVWDNGPWENATQRKSWIHWKADGWRRVRNGERNPSFERSSMIDLCPVHSGAVSYGLPLPAGVTVVSIVDVPMSGSDTR